ncbi:uncharacterized protein LOC126965326 [Leptidea sinapis]|uniref:uncharacterized protein LOC126965326 n=1 Tax=Leptidea sinapis TaxID=189913 RepID=UPI0021414E81|nr:uncharacterized protein LOC126965326 [Leptidea sinapis]
MERLIESVHRYPCLWDTGAAAYRDQELKDEAWLHVLKETELASVKEVKLKWKKLRDSYRDALKRQSELAARDPHGAARKGYSWKYLAQMQFLQPHMNARKRPVAPPAASRSSDLSDSEAEGTRPRPRTPHADQLMLIDRKLDFLCRAHSTRLQQPPDVGPHPNTAVATASAHPDPLEMFFSSMCQSTKRFPYHTQISIKKALFGAVIDAEKALLAEQQNYASLWPRGPASSSSGGGDAGGGDDDDRDLEEEDRKPS